MNKDVTKSEVEQDIEWEQGTISGMIFVKLKEAAASQGIPVSISNKDGMMERFRFGEEEAYLLKTLEGGTTGDNNGRLVTRAEGWQYKRMKWWKEGIDKSGVKLEFLDVPFLWIAKDAKIDDYASIFSPAQIVAKFAPGVTDEEENRLKDSAKSLLSNVLKSQLLIPDYGVIDMHGGLRAAALTTQAVEGRTQDNPTYQALVNRIREIAPNLPTVFANLSGNISS